MLSWNSHHKLIEVHILVGPHLLDPQCSIGIHPYIRILLICRVMSHVTHTITSSENCSWFASTLTASNIALQAASVGTINVQSQCICADFNLLSVVIAARVFCTLWVMPHGRCRFFPVIATAMYLLLNNLERLSTSCVKTARGD